MQRRLVVSHTFRGGRFDDHGVDLSVLAEVLRYRELLVEVAKEIWRREHPSSKQLPKHFEQTCSLKFYELQCNCATIPIERLIDNSKILPEKDELDDAAELIIETVNSAREDRPLPNAFPKRLLGLFKDYGKSLLPDEWIEQRRPLETEGARYDAEVSARLAARAEQRYESYVEIIGMVTMARVTNPRMMILVDGREVEAPFPLADESKITTALKEHATTRVRVVGRGTHDPTGQLLRLIHVERIDVLPEGQYPFDPEATPIWEQFQTVAAAVADEEFEQLPTDAAQHLDNYLYGSCGAEQ